MKSEVKVSCTNWHKHLGFTDFTPSFGYHTFFSISTSYRQFSWLVPIDEAIIKYIDTKGALKAFESGLISAPDVNLIYGENYYKPTLYWKFYLTLQNILQDLYFFAHSFVFRPFFIWQSFESLNILAQPSFIRYTL